MTITITCCRLVTITIACCVCNYTDHTFTMFLRCASLRVRKKVDLWLQAPGSYPVAFWQMKTSRKEDECNMEIYRVKGKVAHARNTVALKAQDTLILWRPDITEKAPSPLSLVSDRPAKRVKARASA